jgi:hypothetical protein
MFNHAETNMHKLTHRRTDSLHFALTVSKQSLILRLNVGIMLNGD